MRLLNFRLIVSLILGITLVSFGFSYYEVLGQKRTLRNEMEHRAEMLGESLVGNVERSWTASSESAKSDKELQQLVQQFANREHLLGVVIYDRQGAAIAITPELARTLTATLAPVAQSITQDREESSFTRLGQVPVHILALPIHRGNDVLGDLAVVHDVSYIRAEILLVWRRSFFRVLAQVFLIVLITLLIVRWSIAGPIARAALWMRALRTGKVSFRQDVPDLDMFRPLAREVATMAESLNHARNAAENEARLREAGESLWTADRLSVQLRARLQDGHLFVVSNREPYAHQRNGRTVEVVVPPSGLVTALEPVLNACDGTWIAHGNGNADAEVVDAADRLRVPPDDPRYTLRRVWLSKEEEEGYYYGFANEGLWPLCHIAHTRPLFRAADWQYYQDVNRKFAAAVLEEIKSVRKPVVLVQDYHFALLPRLIKEQRPDARVAIFWHIPWPNPEAFGICPWQRQLVDGLLGADLIGFHIQSHCNNFLETVDRVVESRVDWEHFSVLRQDHRTIVRPFPVSVDFVGDDAAESDHHGFNYLERSALLRSLGVEATFMGIGVDRVDYTKGILERFLAIERFLEKYPSYQGKFTFVQIGAPSRTHIKRYHDLLAEVEAEAERINWRFQSGSWKPIVFLKRQHSHEEIEPYYRAAALCLVTSLHDGMNLVAKEFAAARRDERGVLILSQFTGAARELRDALLVNPYDIDQTAEAIRAALEMEPEEKQMRMHRMRELIKEHNIYRWAGDLVTALCEVRLDAPKDANGKARASASVFAA
ncbi:MAG TPA: trehalose-6-phosphate synthase [Terriglobales bacterium]|jgi:trehalose-6-phosphate synthase|nr:trehalose-6-phosphate synthase [Terriglobales bacterium]